MNRFNSFILGFAAGTSIIGIIAWAMERLLKAGLREAEAMNWSAGKFRRFWYGD